MFTRAWLDDPGLVCMSAEAELNRLESLYALIHKVKTNLFFALAMCLLLARLPNFSHLCALQQYRRLPIGKLSKGRQSLHCLQYLRPPGGSGTESVWVLTEIWDMTRSRSDHSNGRPLNITNVSGDTSVHLEQ